MASVLDPSAVTDLLSGYFVWSSEDDRAYIVTAFVIGGVAMLNLRVHF